MIFNKKSYDNLVVSHSWGEAPGGHTTRYTLVCSVSLDNALLLVFCVGAGEAL
jgi:hypothetical protein